MLDVTQASGLFWATVFGAAIGVVAGTFIQFFLTKILERQSTIRQKTILMKELTYNRALVNELFAEEKRLRNAVNGGVLDTYNGFFPFGNAIFAQAQAAALNGAIYELLSKDQVRLAQKVVFLLSAQNSNWVAAEIAKRKNSFINSGTTFDQRDAVNFVDFLEQQIHDIGKSLDELISALS